MCLLRPPPRSPSPAFLRRARARRAAPLEGTRERKFSHPSPSQNKSGGGVERKRFRRPEKLTVVSKVTVSYARPTLMPRNLTGGSDLSSRSKGHRSIWGCPIHRGGGLPLLTVQINS